jgi:hypothetical protein
MKEVKKWKFEMRKMEKIKKIEKWINRKNLKI